IHEALAVLDRELGVDRKPDDLARILAAAGEPDRKLDALTRAAHGDVGLVLLGCEYLLKQRAELHLAPRTPRLHVAEHPLEVTSVAGEPLHLAEALVHLLEPLGDQLEALAEALLERALQLLVHRLSHPLEALPVLLLDAPKALVDDGADAVEVR